LKLRDGWGIANYSGPGTHVKERLKRGDQPRSVVDSIAEAHDIDYSLAKDLKAVRAADTKMLDSLHKAAIAKTDNPLNITIAKAGIGAKVFAEDNLGLRKSLFIDPSTTVNTKVEEARLKRERAKLEQKGYGFDESGQAYRLPGQELKDSLMKVFPKSKTKGKGKGSKGKGKCKGKCTCGQHSSPGHPIGATGPLTVSNAMLKKRFLKRLQTGSGFVDDVQALVRKSGKFLGRKLSEIPLEALIPLIIPLLA